MHQLLTRWPALSAQLEAAGLRLLAALAVAAIGALLIRVALRLTGAALARARVAPTIAGFVTKLLRALLLVFLVAVLLETLGLRLASVAALMAGVGIALGGALSGLLGDFAAGLLLLLLRPFEVGDDIAVGDVAGEVVEIGVFRTVLLREDNVAITIGNSALLGAVIERRDGQAAVQVRRRLLLPPHTDTAAVIAALAPQLAALAIVLPVPAPKLRTIEPEAGHPVIEIRAHCAAADRDALGFAINRLAAALPRALPVSAHRRVVLLPG